VTTEPMHIISPRARGHNRALGGMRRAIRLDSGGSEKRGETDLLRGAEFRHCAVEHVKVVEEIDG
jgi:hypothetical protein